MWICPIELIGVLQRYLNVCTKYHPCKLARARVDLQEYWFKWRLDGEYGCYYLMSMVEERSKNRIRLEAFSRCRDYYQRHGMIFLKICTTLILTDSAEFDMQYRIHRQFINAMEVNEPPEKN